MMIQILWHLYYYSETWLIQSPWAKLKWPGGSIKSQVNLLGYYLQSIPTCTRKLKRFLSNQKEVRMKTSTTGPQCKPTRTEW